MFEVLVVALSLFCNAPEPLPNDYVSAVIESGVLMEEVYGSHPYDLPTAPSEDGMLSYRIMVDPLYQSYEQCFIQEVRSILTDERSWPSLRESEFGEVPQVWIILAPPGACGTIEYPEQSCAAGVDGQGQTWVNYSRWIKGSSYTDAPISDDRSHLVNHEVGHHLGYEHSVCTKDQGNVMTPVRDTSSCEYQSWPTEKRTN